MWLLFTVNAIGNHGSVRFKELCTVLHVILPSTLSSNMRQLKSHGIVKRRPYAEIPPRVEYNLSANGLELRKAIISLFVWANRQVGYSRIEENCDASQYVKVSF